MTFTAMRWSARCTTRSASSRGFSRARTSWWEAARLPQFEPDESRECWIERPRTRPLRGHRQGQQEGRRLRARHFQDQESQVRDRGGHHDSEDRRPHQAGTREGGGEVIPAGIPVWTAGRLKNEAAPWSIHLWLVVCTTLTNGLFRHL